jgi:serine/threonine protein phosphatase PrpC
MAELTLEHAVRSDIGHRENNEDAAFATQRLAVIADGVGGAAGGEVASRAVIDALMSLDKSMLNESLEDSLHEAVRRANETVGFLSQCRPELTGMASTLTAVAISDDGRLIVANVGDSRTYLLRAGVLSQLTRDDSLVQELLDHGAITELEARQHPQRFIVTAALDGRERDEIPVTSLPALAGDRLLLCSDGLSDVVDDDEITRALALPASAAAADRLIELALGAGGQDNISVVVADVVTQSDGSPNWPIARHAAA